MSAASDLAIELTGQRFGTILADPPWRFQNRTGKVAPEHRRLCRHETLSVDEIAKLPIADHLDETAHCYLWVPNALLPCGLQVLASWGFEYKNQLGLAQGPEGRWIGRPRGWILFPQCDRVDPLRRSGQGRTDAAGARSAWRRQSLPASACRHSVTGGHQVGAVMRASDRSARRKAGYRGATPDQIAPVARLKTEGYPRRDGSL